MSRLAARCVRHPVLLDDSVERAAATTGLDSFAVMARVAQLSSDQLWPGFDPCRVPVALYDGAMTCLFSHPAPPGEFSCSPDHLGVLLVPARHPSLVANSTGEIGGVLTATVDLTGLAGRTVTEVAAIVIHEAFHVIQHERHPTWGANEADLFLYPVDDPDLLALRLLEDMALRRALTTGNHRQALGWAALALDLRRERFASLAEGAAAYERATELHEGLARYIEWRLSPGRPDGLLPEGGFAPDAIRLRGYAMGTAWALLLDRFTEGWREDVERGAALALDDLLHSRLVRQAVPDIELPASERARARVRATAEVAALVERRVARRDAFLSLPGWRLIVEIGAGEPLWSRGFDPMNVERLGPADVLHGRYLALGNASGALEVLNHPSLTVAAGDHPLFTGVRRVMIAGLGSPPEVRESGCAVGWDLAGCQGEFRGARLHWHDQKVVFHIAPNP